MYINHSKIKAEYYFRKIFSLSASSLLNKAVWVCYNKNKHNIVNPRNGEPAYNDLSSTWGTYTAACEYIDSHEEYTLAIQLSGNAEISAVHISNCVDPDGSITNKYQLNKLIKSGSSYKEYDISGKGITFLFLGNDISPYEAYAKKVGDIEVELYDYYQCIPLTGNTCLPDKEERDSYEVFGVPYNENYDPYIMVGGKHFINAIYEWFAGRFTDIKSSETNISEIRSDILGTESLPDNEKQKLNTLIQTNQYFRNLWDRITPTDKGAKHDDIDLVARIYASITTTDTIIDMIFKASPSFKAKSESEQSRFKVITVQGKDPGFKLPFKDVGPCSYMKVSPYMAEILESAKIINQSKNFMKYDNDIDLLKDKVYGDIIDLSSDTSCADIFIEAYGKRIKYCTKESVWYVFNGSYWIVESNKTLEHIRSYGEQLARRLNTVLDWYDMDVKEKKKMRKDIAKFVNVTPFKRVLESARSKCVIDLEAFNPENQKLSVGNGTVDLRTGVMKRHNPMDLFTLHTDIKYYPSYPQPRKFIEFLNDIFKGDGELISYFQRVMGYCITGDTDAQVFFVFYGDGGNGKSTLFKILGDVLGKYAGTFDAYALAKKNEGEGRANPPLLQNRFKRYIIIPEKNASSELDIALIKAISGGDPISARMLYQNNSEPFRPTYKMIFTTNFLPNINWDDEGIKRRYRIIPFENRFRGAAAVPNLAEEILKDEKEMILKWLIDGAKEYYKHECRLDDVPKSMVKAMNKARRKQDSLYAYMQDCLDVTHNEKYHRIQSTVLYKEFIRWCIEHNRNENEISETDFGRRMPEVLGVKKEKHQKMYYIGVKFKEEK